MDSDEQRRLLGQFIRSHRERVTPDVPTRRRRTPGLRREELAVRAGIGVTWCAWIEQGRDVHPSPEALARVAIALSLTPAERAYLFELAERRDPEAPHTTPAPEAPASLRALVEAVAHPAYGLDKLWNACCWNEAAEHLFAGWLGPGEEKNLLHYTFATESARALLPDWEDRTRRLLAEFRADYGRSLDDAAFGEFVDGLKRESDLFARLWSEHSVVTREGGLRAFSHPTDGSLLYEQHTYIPPERPDYKLVVLFPQPDQL